MFTNADRVRRLGLSLFLFTVTALGQKEPVTFDRLMGQTLRPTMDQIRALVADPSFTYPPRGLLRAQISLVQQISQSAKDLPLVIATMEKYYPGAVWAPLGRDAFNLGDILDAFYLSLGQSGRVARINMSTATFHSATSQQIEELVEGLGFDFDNALSNPPFVVFDNTSYGQSSQSTIFMRAVYAAWKKRGNKLQDLVERFNLISTSSGEPPTVPREIFFSHVTTTEDRPIPILRVHEAAQLMYGLEWHGPFGALQRHPTMGWSGQPGPAQQLANRQNILLSQIEWNRIVSAPSFLESVKREALKLGYEFSLTRGEVPPPIPPEERQRRFLESLRTSLEQLVQELPLKGEQTAYLSTNGQRFQQWLDSTVNATSRNALCLLFVRQILNAQKAGKLGERDLRRLIARAMGQMTVPDEVLGEKFLELYRESEILREILDTRRGVFVQSKQRDGAAVAKTFTYLEQALGCAGILLAQEPPKTDAPNEGKTDG